MNARDLEQRLRLIVITDTPTAAPRTVTDVVAQALKAGAPAIQIREKGSSARGVIALAEALLPLTRQFDALLFINDRLDVALAAGVDGVHLGPLDLGVAAARSVSPPNFLVGYSTDDPATASEAISMGADYIGCGAVYATSTKADAGDTIGLEGLRSVVGAAQAPVVAIGGITPELAGPVRDEGAAGCAVVSAVMGAGDVAGAVEGFLRPWQP